MQLHLDYYAKHILPLFRYWSAEMIQETAEAVTCACCKSIYLNLQALLKFFKPVRVLAIFTRPTPVRHRVLRVLV
jgi:hypothetical protein